MGNAESYAQLPPLRESTNDACHLTITMFNCSLYLVTRLFSLLFLFFVNWFFFATKLMFFFSIAIFFV